MPNVIEDELGPVRVIRDRKGRISMAVIDWGDSTSVYHSSTDSWVNVNVKKPGEAMEAKKPDQHYLDCMRKIGIETRIG